MPEEKKPETSLDTFSSEMNILAEKVKSFNVKTVFIGLTPVDDASRRSH
ncbi:MAG: hypothetical protein ACOCWQ_03595 [Nanoarchaeota archaeon]